ncbi:hypothetical protein LOY44_01605 [Pseudomonas sp. B21-044]|uniref:hypothetical protein n=1 Tax=Pseudomonas sp. B21-044 TaxID=2895488 RepID=UPI00215F7F02|nr:hypothetical protein [Pseudomonas sp. B21-044]UVL19639.1 hypothetical protein LOY44_01605 [Pseudomonas sp. B21-044]
MPKLLVNTSEILKTFAHLEKTADNTAFYEALTGVQHIHEIAAEAQCLLAPGYRLIRVDHRKRPTSDEFEIALVNDLERSVVYYNRVVISPIVDLKCRPATQNLVWRSQDAQHLSVLSPVAQKVFFNYILEKYDVIVSDGQQTHQGKFFWQRQMSQAIAFGLHVYYYQMMTAKLEPILSQADLNALKDQLWSEDDGQEYHLALISKVELPAELLITTESSNS